MWGRELSVPVVLALDFGGSKIAATVAGVDGTRIDSTVVATDPTAGARHNFELGVSTGRALLHAAGSERRLVAVGASSFGNPHDDRVELAPAIPGWESLAFGNELRAAFPDAVLRLTNDVKAAALAEVADGALTGCDPAVYLNLGTGLAAAIVVDGVVLLGAHGAAGEVGLSLRRAMDVDEPAPVKLEDAIGGGALDLHARRSGSWSDAAAMFAAGEDRTLVNEVVRELAMLLVNLAITVDPVRIAVGGGMTRSWHVLRPAFERALAAHTPFPPQLVLARHPHEAPLLGALGLAIEAAVRTTHPSVPTASAFGHEPLRSDRIAVASTLGERNPT